MNLKEPDQIKKMREAGLLLWETHKLASQLISPEVSTKEINLEIENFILTRKAIPMFKGVPGKVPYPAASCISINEQVVHGIPSERKLKEGDIVSIDIGVKLNGWCADAAITYPVGIINKKLQSLLTVTENALRESIILLGTKSRWSIIVKKTSENIQKAGFSIVEELVGHAIGKDMWESPQVPNYYDQRNPDFRIKPGLVLAIEPMVNVGSKEVETLQDHWTIVTKDKLPSAHFEHTVAITDNGPVVLTCGSNGEGWAMP
jgi:methionyl aminopeptidase